MVYARAYGQTVAEDYFAAMQRVEQRLEIAPPKQEEPAMEIMPKLKYEQVLALAEELSMHELGLDQRLAIAQRLRELFGKEQSLLPPEKNMRLVRCERAYA